MNIAIIILIGGACLSFLIAAFNPPPQPVSSIRLIGLGLFLITLYILITSGGRI